MAHLGQILLKPVRNGLFTSRLLPVVRPSNQTCYRFVHVELPDEDNEKLLQLDHFEESYQRLKLPFKLNQPDKKEQSKQFIKLRFEKYFGNGRNGIDHLKVDDYHEIFDPLEGEAKEKIINDISMVVDFFNRVLSKSIFSPSSIPLEGK